MSDPVVGAIERVAKTWREEAKKRRGISAVDSVADTLDYCAGELAARLRAIGDGDATETVEACAARHGVTEQTVRTWIRTNQLPAHRGSKGYEIPKGAERVRRVG